MSAVTIDTQHDALLVVDVQRDFCPGGALAVPGGDAVVPVINRILPLFHIIVFSRDYHPPDHCSFDPNPQFVDTSWPPHCVAGTPGAAFHPGLIVPEHALIIDKGIHKDHETYSCFRDSDLTRWLREKTCTRVFITGLATEYCIRFTVMDALEAAFETVVITDAIRGVNIPPGSAEEALNDMKQAGATLIHSGDILHDRTR